MSDKKEEKTSFILGLLRPNIKRGAGAAVKNLKFDLEMAEGINNMRHQLLEKEESKILKSDSQDPKKRFEDGMKQFEVSDKEIKEKAEQSTIMFNFLSLITAIVLAIVIVNFPIKSSLFNIIIFLMPALSLILLLLVSMSKWGFYNYCIRNKAMLKFKDWIKNPKEWLPSSNIKVLAIMGFVLSIAMSGNAMAADTSSTSNCTTSGSYVAQTFALPCDKDVYKNMLELIFPDVTPLKEPTIVGDVNQVTAENNGTIALASAFQAFLSVLMSLAMSGLAFHMVSTLVSVAHEGSMISQRWSVIWSPIRVFMGAGALAPFIKGYCIAQIAVLYIALWSGSLSNVMWSAYVTGLASPTISPSTMPNLQSPFMDISTKVACWEVLTNYNNTLDSSTPKTLPQSEFVSDVNQIKTPSLNTIFGNNESSNADSKVIVQYAVNFGPYCGSINYSIPALNSSGGYGTYGTQIKKVIDNYITNIDVPIKNQVKNSMASGSGNSASTTDISTTISKIRSEYNTAVTNWGSAMVDFTKTLNAQANSGAMQTFISNSQTYGWVTAGSYYMNLSRMQGFNNDIMGVTDITSGATNENDDNYKSEKNSLETSLGMDILNQLANNIKSSFGTSGSVSLSSAESALNSASKGGSINGLNVNTNTLGFDSSSGAWGKAVNWIAGMLSQAINAFFSYTGSGATDNSSNPGGSELQQMIEFGYNLISIAETIFGVLFLAKAGALIWGTKLLGDAASAVLSGGSSIPAAAATSGIGLALKSLGGSVLSILMMLTSFLMVAGVVHAYILPMMPYIHFSLFVMSMIIFVVEAMIAVPLWAFIHIKLNGQELIGQEQRTGYMLLFNLFLRAPLGMFGLFLSLSVFNAMMFFLKLTFYPAVYSGQNMTSDLASGDNQMGMVGLLVMLLMMTYLHFIIAMRSFELISELPDRVAKWFGASQVGGESRIGEALKGFMTGTVAGQLGRQMTSTFSPKPGGPGGGGGRQPASNASGLSATQADTPVVSPNSDRSNGGGTPQGPSGGQPISPSGGGDDSPSSTGISQSSAQQTGSGGSESSGSSTPSVAQSIQRNHGRINNSIRSKMDSQGASIINGSPEDNGLRSFMGSLAQDANSGRLNDVSHSSFAQDIDNRLNNAGINNPILRNIITDELGE